MGGRIIGLFLGAILLFVGVISMHPAQSEIKESRQYLLSGFFYFNGCCGILEKISLRRNG